jgi:hypothetical protein
MEPGSSVAATWALGLRDVEHDNIEQSHIEDSMQSITTDTAPLTNLEEPLRGQMVPEQITRSTLTEPKETLETEQVKPRFYQAIGFVEGILEIDDQKSILRIGEDSYPAVVQKRLKAKCKTTETQLQCFQVYPAIIKGHLGFMIVKIGKSPLSFFTLNGCWAIHNEEPRLIIYRNQQSQNDSQKRSILPLIWPDAPPADGRFWELEARLESRKLVVIKAKGSFDPPPHGFQHRQKNAQIKQSPETIALLKTTFITTERIRKMAALVEARINCKVSSLPEYQELPDQQIKFFLTSGNGCIFSVMMKPQMFQKLAEHNFEQKEAFVSGILGAATATGFKLIQATVECSAATEVTPLVLKAEKPEAIEMENSVSNEPSHSTKQLLAKKPPTSQKILAVVAKDDSPQEPEAKGAKSKKKANEAKK